MNLSEKSGLKNPRAAHLEQLLRKSWEELYSVYLQSLMERTSIICEAVIAAKGVLLMNQKFQIYFG